MFTYENAFSSFSVDNLQKAKEFYGVTLGLQIEETSQGLELDVKGTDLIFIYQKDEHEPATYTALNFVVEDIEKVVDELTLKGIVFEQYEGMMQTDAKGIAHIEGGPTMAWFKDPAGNFLALLQK